MAPERRAPSKTAAAPARKRAPAAKPGGRTRTAAAKSGKRTRAASPEERDRLIAERAYLKAESRAFQGGSAEQDWLEAEAEVDALLGGTNSKLD